VLLTAQAQDLEATQPSRAAELATEAHRIAPDFVPAAVIAGRILAGQGNSYKAARVLARTWQYTPHPDLAIGYAYARPGDSPHDRLSRIKSLIVLTPDHAEARIALASAAVDARQWAEAREALQPLLSKNPTARVCALMARIEGGENRDAGRVREWLARAVRAPRDPVWMADGVASGEWQPISPVTGALDAFEWRVPPEPSRTGTKDALLDEVTALGQELEAVTRKIADVQTVDAPSASQPGEPLTITVKAEEVPAAEAKSAPAPEPVKPIPMPSAESQVVQAAPAPKKTDIVQEKPIVPAAEVAEAKPVAVAEPRPSMPSAPTPVTPLEPQPARQQKKSAPKIFVPDRPPDDPGPGSTDIEEPNTPYARFRSSYKPQPT
jgi:HemY protein